VESLNEKAIGRHRYRWEDNIKMDLKEMELEGVDVDQFRDIINTAMKLLVP
jgi:hypothetical protein